MFKIIKNLRLIWLLIISIAGTGNAQDVIADHGMVASAHPLASRAGLQILQDGGNAVDAAVATALALAVVEPNASGLGGGGFVVIKMADESEAVTIDYRETAPAAATPGLYYDNSAGFKAKTHDGPLSVGVPGVVAGLSQLLNTYGTLDFKRVSAPAIQLAEQGYEVTPNFENMIIQAYDLIYSNPASAQIYLADGLPPSAGATIKNPHLASTLQRMAAAGSEVFYNGVIADSIVTALKNLGGILNKTDLENYRALLKKPVIGSYRGYQIASAAPPTGGGTHLIELLNIMQGFDLNKMKSGSADYLHLLAEAMKMVLADKAENMADPDFYNVPVKQLTSAEHAQSLRKKIDPGKAMDHYQPPNWLSGESGSTTHLSVIDSEGNAVALTQSINLWFGSGITVPGTGIILNNHLADFDSEPGHANSIEPGKRPVSSIAPTILLKDGKPFLSIGTPGGSRIIGALAQIIINIIDFGMTVDEAIEAPRIHVTSKELHAEGRIPGDILEKLRERGHDVKVHADFDNYFGGAQGVLMHADSGKLSAGADSRRDGVALGY